MPKVNEPELMSRDELKQAIADFNEYTKTKKPIKVLRTDTPASLTETLARAINTALERAKDPDKWVEEAPESLMEFGVEAGIFVDEDEDDYGAEEGEEETEAEEEEDGEEEEEVEEEEGEDDAEEDGEEEVEEEDDEEVEEEDDEEVEEEDDEEEGPTNNGVVYDGTAASVIDCVDAVLSFISDDSLHSLSISKAVSPAAQLTEISKQKPVASAKPAKPAKEKAPAIELPDPEGFESTEDVDAAIGKGGPLNDRKARLAFMEAHGIKSNSQGKLVDDNSTDRQLAHAIKHYIKSNFLDDEEEIDDVLPDPPKRKVPAKKKVAAAPPRKKAVAKRRKR
jgi:archaellum component FlaD/FlaE